MKLIVFISFGLSALPYQVFAETDQDKIGRILDAIEDGWERGDGAPFRKHFLDFNFA